MNSRPLKKPEAYIEHLTKLLTDAANHAARRLGETTREQFLTFSRGTARFGLSYRQVAEVLVTPSLTPVPGAPDPFTLLTFSGGRLIPVVDLTIQPESSGHCPLLIRIDLEGLAVGVMADSVMDILPLDADRPGRNLSGRILLPVRFSKRVLVDEDSIRYREVDLAAILESLRHGPGGLEERPWT